MRVLIFHGYLLHGTGSNVYNSELARALVELGHEVHLICQERHPFNFDWVDAAADWDSGVLATAVKHKPVEATVYRPDIEGLLPVFVADQYEGTTAKVFPDFTEPELDNYIERNVAAVREVAERVKPDLALANHLVMGPVILARALGGAVPYAVKVHGSDIEYALQPYPRFIPFAEEGVTPAKAVLVGSGHIAKRLHETVELPGLKERVFLGPPGVNVEAFAPGESRLNELIARLRNTMVKDAESSVFTRNTAKAADALNEIASTDQLAIFVGKLIGSKGVDLLIAAWPRVLETVPNARLVIVGFGEFEQGLREFQQAISEGELERAGEMTTERGLPLKWTQGFLNELTDSEREHYVTSATKLEDRISWIGRLDHSELVDLLPAADAMVVPSVFPEAFGMVAIEGAACGLFPIVTNHSGLAEVAVSFAEKIPPPTNSWLTFPKGTGAIPQLAENLINWLTAPEELRNEVRDVLVSVTRSTYSWHGVARRVIAAGLGKTADLQAPDRSRG